MTKKPLSTSKYAKKAHDGTSETVKSKFPKCQAYGLNVAEDLLDGKIKRWLMTSEAKHVEQALTQAENKGIQLGKDIGIRVGFTQGAKAKQERWNKEYLKLLKEHVGNRHQEPADGCSVCEAWKTYDKLKAELIK